MNGPAERDWMFRALRLAEQGRGSVEPNPLVGAVLVRDGRAIGEGWHQQYGGPHAEVHALAAGDARGATLYVTLEPCCHHGKTPPCTDAVIRAGVARVVAAMADPFAAVDGQGLTILRDAGVEVEVGLCGDEARRLNAPYLKLLRTGRPYVHAKWAMTLDGKIATRTGDSKWISGEASRARAHALRGRMDAIVVGIGTVLADDALLTARPPGPRTATRVVLDSRCRLPLSSQIARTAAAVPTLILTEDFIPAEVRRPLEEAGCELLPILQDRARADALALLDELGRRRMTNVLVEGGSQVLGSFIDADAADEFHVYVAPRIVGGKLARSAVGGKGAEKIADALAVADWEVERLGPDLYLHGRRG